MKQEKIVFLILHYFSIEDTQKCIESIKNIINYDNYEILIIDNGSNNNSGVELQKQYANDEKIHIILSEQNLGFARGNNLGFKYIKENLNPDFIVMINNDVYMLQENFCDLVIKEYENSKYSVLGPRILMNNNTICAYEDKMPSLKEVKSKKRDNKILYFFNKIYLRKLYSLILKIKIKVSRKNNSVDTSIRKENVMLHGCCLIFSKEYINKFDGIDDRTFLYYEEPLLYLRVKKNNLKSVYNPYLMIYHNENASTNKTNTNKRKKFDFVLKNEIQSLEIVIKELED